MYIDNASASFAAAVLCFTGCIWIAALPDLGFMQLFWFAFAALATGLNSYLFMKNALLGLREGNDPAQPAAAQLRE